MKHWDEVTFERDQCRHWRVAPADVWVARSNGEWHVASHHESGPRPSSDPGTGLVNTAICERPPDDIEWNRWVAGDSTTLRLTPVTPDRPVVVRPEDPIRILSGCEALFFVKLPIWIRVSARGVKGREMTLCELPTSTLSNIWFGDPMTGELCYSARTWARRTFEPDTRRANFALCPIRILNISAQELDFQRLCIRGQHLNIYEGEQQLWATGVKLKYRGADQISRLEYESKAPEWERTSRILSQARVPFRRNLLKRSFSNFRFLADPWV